MYKILFVILIASCLVPAQTKKPDAWEPLRFFVGKWAGTGKGQPGASTVEREYKFTLSDKFLQAGHKSIYAPQEKNPKGEVHEDLGFFSYDRRRKQIIFRQFHVESFVIHYVLASVSADGKTLVFDSESIENIPAGYKARETYKILSENEFTETFEISEPGKEYEVYSENRFKRKK
jgi:hypothetical protein